MKEDTTMRKKEYMMPSMEVVKVQQQGQILAGSLDVYGMNEELVSTEEVTEGWAREFAEGDDWDWSE